MVIHFEGIVHISLPSCPAVRLPAGSGWFSVGARLSELPHLGVAPEKLGPRGAWPPGHVQGCPRPPLSFPGPSSVPPVPPAFARSRSTGSEGSWVPLGPGASRSCGIVTPGLDRPSEVLRLGAGAAQGPFAQYFRSCALCTLVGKWPGVSVFGGMRRSRVSVPVRLFRRVCRERQGGRGGVRRRNAAGGAWTACPAGAR